MATRNITGDNFSPERGTLKITSTNTYGNTITENFGKFDPDYLINSETRATVATQIDSFGRAVIGLTTNSYTDAIVEVKFSINEILEE